MKLNLLELINLECDYIHLDGIVQEIAVFLLFIIVLGLGLFGLYGQCPGFLFMFVRLIDY